MYKFKLPISFYFGLLLSLTILVNCVIKIPLPDSLIYPLVVFGLWFLTISNYSCQVILYEDKLIVKYFMFWHNNKEINLLDKKINGVKTSYFSFNLRYDSHTIKNYIFYDTIDFIDSKGNIETIKLNIRIGQLNKLIKKLNYVEKL